MRGLHIVQGGIENGDKRWLEQAARDRLSTPSWVAPKSSTRGDDVVVYIRGYGFFATGRITSLAKPRVDWKNRYGAGLSSIKLIKPPVSLGAILRHLPELKWAKYPRSITTPTADSADRIRRLIRKRRTSGIPDLDDDALATSSLDELRAVALLSQRKFVTPRQRKILYRARSAAIRLYVLRRANGYCEGCRSVAPFLTSDGSAYLEAHHIHRLADDGPDHPRQVIALCANCHRRAHHSVDRASFTRTLRKRMISLEPI
jgi:5-methylcytosine-specific restriction endonuclease McrA